MLSPMQKDVSLGDVETISSNSFTPSKDGVVYFYGSATGGGAVMTMSDTSWGAISYAYAGASGTGMGGNAFVKKGRTYSFATFNASITAKKFIPLE